MALKIEEKLLGDMIPGELLRFEYRRKMLLGVAAQCEFLRIPSGLVIVVLEDIPERPGTATGCVPINEYLAARTGLSYGSGHELVVLPSAPVVSANDKRFPSTGALLVGSALRGLQSVYLGDTLNDSALIINIDRWAAIPNRYDHPAHFAVLEWELRMIPNAPTSSLALSIYTFKANG